MLPRSLVTLNGPQALPYAPHSILRMQFPIDRDPIRVILNRAFMDGANFLLTGVDGVDTLSGKRCVLAWR